jgi:hypothetical protein
LLNPGHDVFTGEDVRLAVVPFHALDTDLAAALRGQNNVRPPVLYNFADEPLAQPVIDRRIDIIDADVNHVVDEFDRLLLTQISR